MYKSVIDIQKGISEELLETLKDIAEKAFNNRMGKVLNVSENPYCLVYAGEEEERACLEIGMLILKKNLLFLQNINSWQWIDEDPSENCDLLKLFTKRMVRSA